jgi:hypothetical protein
MSKLIAFAMLVLATPSWAQTAPSVNGVLTLNQVPNGWTSAPVSSAVKLDPGAIAIELVNDWHKGRVRIVATPVDVGDAKDHLREVRDGTASRGESSSGIGVFGDSVRAWMKWKCREPVTRCGEAPLVLENAWFVRNVTDADGRKWTISVRGVWQKFGFAGEEITTIADFASVNGSPVTGPMPGNSGDNFAPTKDRNGNQVATFGGKIRTDKTISLPGDGALDNGQDPNASRPVAEPMIFRILSWQEKD